MNYQTLPPKEIPELCAKVQELKIIEDDIEWEGVVILNSDDYSEYYHPANNDTQYLAITENPKYQAGIKDKLQEWLAVDVGVYGVIYVEDYWHNPKYQESPRLWELRAFIAFMAEKDEK